MGLIHCFVAGGWPMYPIMILGLGLVFASVLLVKRSTPQVARLVSELRYITLVLGFLGTTLGMIHCLMSLPSLPADQPFVNYALLGFGEALNCLSAALTMIGLSALVTTAGALRTGPEPERAG